MAVNSFREDEYMENTDKKKILSRLLSYLFDYKLAIAGVLVCMGITVGISLVNPLLIEEAIDHYIAQSDFKGLIALGIFALALNVLFIILVKVRMYSMSVISNKILLKIRQDLYEHIQTLSFSFFDSRPTGKILARIIGDVNSLKDVLTNMVTTLIPEFITVIGVVVIMMVKDWRLALASLSTIPIMIAGIFLVQKISHKRWQIYRKKSSNLNAYVHEDIAGMNVVQSFGAEDETKEIFENLTDEHRNAFVDAVIFADMFGPVIDFCWGIGAMMLYLVGIRFLGFEKVSVGLLVACGSYINMFWNPIMNLSNFYNNLVTNLTAAERIFDILDTEPDITDAEDVEELPEVKGEVTFSHVGFTYDRGTPAETKVLEDVNFVVKPGETIALVGPTGAGKTTIAENLKARYVTAFRKIDHYHSRVRVLKDISQLKKDATPIDASNPHGKKQKAGKFTSVAKFGYYFLDFLIGNVKIAIAKIKSTLVLVERYYYDYSIDKVRYNLNLSDKFLLFFEHFVLKPDVIFILTGDSKKLLDRKHEITIDEIDEQKRKLNERFINNPKAVFIDTTEGTVDECVNKMLKECNAIMRKRRKW